MATYTTSCITVIGGQTGGSSVGSQFAAFRGSTTLRSEIKEIAIFQATAGTSPNGIGLTRSTAIGTGALTGVTGIPLDPNVQATTGQLVTAYATAAPTVTVTSGANIIKRFVHNTAVGNGVVWTFDMQSPLYVPLGGVATGELVFINLFATAPATYHISITWNE